jgi:hypothetical protein
MLTPNIVFGYHGCDESVARRVLDGGHLKPSQNAYDWLGHGIYFWEGSAGRAKLWAQEMSRFSKSGIKKPAVVGAIIDLGQSLNLIDPENLNSVRKGYQDYLAQCEASGIQPLKNKGTESKARFLDSSIVL